MMTSTDKGVTWSAIRTIQAAPDKPWAGGGTTEGTVFVSWLGNAAGIKRSVDRGVTWGPTQSLGNIIHGTAITTSTTGLVHVPYNLDSNRNQLRYLRSRTNGDTWDATRDLVADMGTFCFSCNPRQHPIVGAGADPTGRVVAITWASRMPGGQADDDVWLLYSSNGGDTWTQPIRVNDNTNASRQFESWVAVDNYGRVHVAWTDFRNGGQNETWYARSADPTAGFEPNLQVTDGRAAATPTSSATTRASPSPDRTCWWSGKTPGATAATSTSRGRPGPRDHDQRGRHGDTFHLNHGRRRGRRDGDRDSAGRRKRARRRRRAGRCRRLVLTPAIVPLALALALAATDARPRATLASPKTRPRAPRRPPSGGRTWPPRSASASCTTTATG